MCNCNQENVNVTVYVERLNDEVVLPEYSKPGDAGMDIRAAEDVRIIPGETAIVKTGLKFSIPEGYEMQVRPRSGLSYNTPLRVSNSPGTIDSGFKDEVGVIITNTSVKADCKMSNAKLNIDLLSIEPEYVEYDLNTKGNRKGIYIIKKGDRIAQIVLNKVPKIQFEEVSNVTEHGNTNNRNSGFGGTGVE